DRQLRRYRPAGLFSHRRFTVADAQNSASRRKRNSLANVALSVAHLASHRLYYLCVGSDAIPSGATVRSDLHRLISDRDYLYRANYGSLEKAGIVAKNTRS